MDLMLLLLVAFMSVVIGICATVIVQWYLFNQYINKLPYVGPKDKPMIGRVCLPECLAEALQSSDIPKKESCLALNLLFQFLFKELRHTKKVQTWFRRKLSLEFEELLTRTTTGKLFDRVMVRDVYLGTEFPAIKSISIKDIQVNSEHQFIESLDLDLDLDYSGGFQWAVDANMVLGKVAYLAVKVIHLAGQARLQFSRNPYTHWSISFYSDPILELDVESQFQGRPLSQITSLITSQMRKTLKKKHTLPNYKIRYKPFFIKSVPGEDEEEVGNQSVNPGELEVTIVEVTRLDNSSGQGTVYCSLAVDSTAWVEVFRSDVSSYITLDIIVTKTPSQQLGIIFKQEFIAERYQACIVIENVAAQSPGSIADVRHGDILVAVDGKRVTSLAQVARLIKAASDKFTIRVERKANYRIPQNDTSSTKGVTDEKKEANIESEGLSTNRHLILPTPGARQCNVPEDKTESDSSSSSPASLPGSPSRRLNLFSRSSHSSPEHKQKTFSSNVADSPDKEMESFHECLHIKETKSLPYKQILLYDTTLQFEIQPRHRYLNVSVWSKPLANDSPVTKESRSKQSQQGPIGKIGKDTLLGHLSIPLASIVNECNSTKLCHLIRCYSLLPPDPHMALSSNHKLSSHSGFEPCLCYGDILLSFVYSSHRKMTSSSKSSINSQGLFPLSTLSSGFHEEKRLHNFVRTQFHRTTQCEFCGKKIWLKDAVQCSDCGMTCHKKCVSKCQTATVCVPGGIQRRASALPEDVGQTRASELLLPTTHTRRASAQPEIITTAAEDETSQGPRRGIGSLLATVASAAQARGLKRAGSANNLALPASANCSHLSRSLPPSPQRSPMVSRKASLAGNPFQFPHSLLDSDAGDVSAALDHLLQHPNDEDLMAVAKSTGKELYCHLPLAERKEKINKMIGKLKAAIDAETNARMSLAREEQETKDPATHAKIAFLIGKSDEKVQALAVLMLHFCAGLQHTQDLEDATKRDADGSGCDISPE